MITYRKKSLKTHIIRGSFRANDHEKYTHAVARGIEEFIEKGEYSRIAEILIFGQDRSCVAIIIYEQTPKEG